MSESPQAPAAPAVDPEDAKLTTLATATMGRTGRPGAAVRDGIGRTYVAAAVELSALRLTAVQAAVAAAVSSGADVIEAVALVGVPLTADDRRLLAEFGEPRVIG